MRTYYILFFFILSFQGYAQTWTEIAELLPMESFESDNFGFAVDNDGDLAVIGAPNHDFDVNGVNPISDAGAVYIFEKDTNGDWIEIQKIVLSTRTSIERFGFSLALSGNYIVVGVTRNDTDASGNNPLLLAGAVYVFERNTSGVFEEVQKLVASDREIGGVFGRAFDIEGDTIIVGAPGEDKDATGNNPMDSPGAAYVFERGTDGVWLETQKLVAAMRSNQDGFGSAIAIDGTNVGIGASQDSDDAQEQNPVTDAGSAYVFTKQGNGLWIETAKVSASDRAVEDEFGDRNIDLDGDYLVVGTRFQDQNTNGTDNREDAGAVYIFEKNMSGDWVEIQKLVASNRDAGDWFGETVGISGDYIITGARREDHDSTNPLFDSGAVYVFKKDGNTWTEDQLIRASNIEQLAIFGNAISINNNELFVGSSVKTTNGIIGGSTYVFELDEDLSNLDYSNSNIIVYPNPTTGLLHLNVNQPQDFNIKVTNIIGQIIHDQRFSATSNLTLKIKGDSGLYFLSFTSAEGVSKTIKVVKQ